MPSTKYLKESGFKVLNLVGGVMLAIAPQKLPNLVGREVVLVSAFLSLKIRPHTNRLQIERSSAVSELAAEIRFHFSRYVGIQNVKTLSLEDISKIELSAKTIVISLLEVEIPLLATMTPQEMDLVKRVTDNSIDLIWLTGASYVDGSAPNLTLASGLSRALMLEQPSLRFVVLDVGSPKTMSPSDRSSVCGSIEGALFANDVPEDKEFVLKDQLLHVSRFVPDHGLNSHFSQRRNHKPLEMTLEAASPARLAIKKVGIMDTIYFQQESEVEDKIPDDLVDIDVKAVILNAKVSVL